jgi:hypothetical protein
MIWIRGEGFREVRMWEGRDPKDAAEEIYEAFILDFSKLKI